MQCGIVMDLVNGDSGVDNSRLHDFFLNDWLNCLMKVANEQRQRVGPFLCYGQ